MMRGKDFRYFQETLPWCHAVFLTSVDTDTQQLSLLSVSNSCSFILGMITFAEFFQGANSVTATHLTYCQSPNNMFQKPALTHFQTFHGETFSCHRTELVVQVGADTQRVRGPDRAHHSQAEDSTLSGTTANQHVPAGHTLCGNGWGCLSNTCHRDVCGGHTVSASQEVYPKCFP